MEKEFVSYEQAVVLKDLGFDKQCLAWHNSKKLFIENYDNCNSKMPFEYCCSLPLKQQVFRWFREKYDAHMHPSRLMRNIYIIRYGDWDSEAFKTYEEAEDACIDKLIELAKQQDK